jgi:DNA-binding NtrC family response regulator
MSEKRTVTIICPQLKDKQLIEICCENLGWHLKHYEFVPEALPYLSDHSVERVFIDNRALTDYHYDIPRIESCANSRAKITLCSKNNQGIISIPSAKLNIVPEPFNVALFLKEMVGDKQKAVGLSNGCPDSLESIIGSSAAVKETRRFCDKFKDNLFPVLVCGSVGSGKNFIAKTLNNLSESKKVFVEISLLELKNLYEWENINYLQVMEVIKDKTALKKNLCVYLNGFQLLDRGNQIKLLEVFEKILAKDFLARQIRVVFSSSNIQPDAQVYDYFYKYLKGGVLVIPDLNTRKRDVIMLFEYFLKHYSESEEVPQVASDVYALLENYRWPGNVRELRLTAAHLSINHSGGVIKTKDLPEYLQVKSFFITHSNVLEDTPRPLEAFEAYYIVEILKSVNGNISKAARQLGVTRNTIKSKLKKADGILNDDFAPLKMTV